MGVNMNDYIEFLKQKSVVDPDTGLASVPPLNKMLYPHQAVLPGAHYSRGAKIEIELAMQLKIQPVRALHYWLGD